MIILSSRDLATIFPGNPGLPGLKLKLKKYAKIPNYQGLLGPVRGSEPHKNNAR